MMEWLEIHFSELAMLVISGGFLLMIWLAKMQVRRELKSPKVTVTITKVSEISEEISERDEDGNEKLYEAYEVVAECVDENGNRQELITYEENPPRVGYTKKAILHTTIFGKKKLISEKELKKHLNKDGKPEGGGVLTIFFLVPFIASVISLCV